MSDPHVRGLDAVTTYLTEQRIAFEVVEHPPTNTAKAEARAAGVPADHAAKTVAMDAEGHFVLAVLPASHRLDFDKARRALGSHGASLRLATEGEIGEHAGPFEVGAVPPLGPLLAAVEIFDERLLEHDTILFSGGDHRHGVLIDPHDLIEVAQPKIADLCEAGPGRRRR
jgi:Ala-tRNA(Pro) deacylase